MAAAARGSTACRWSLAPKMVCIAAGEPLRSTSLDANPPGGVLPLAMRISGRPNDPRSACDLLANCWRSACDPLALDLSGGRSSHGGPYPAHYGHALKARHCGQVPRLGAGVVADRSSDGARDFPERGSRIGDESAHLQETVNHAGIARIDRGDLRCLEALRVCL